MQYLEDKVSCINGELYYNKFIWQQNLLVGCYGTFKLPPGRLDFWCPKGKKQDPPRNSKPKSQRSELKWLWKYLRTPNFCVKFQPNLLTTTFRPWNIFSDYDTWAGFPVFAFFKDDLEARKSLKAFFYSQNYN